MKYTYKLVLKIFQELTGTPYEVTLEFQVNSLCFLLMGTNYGYVSNELHKLVNMQMPEAIKPHESYFPTAKYVVFELYRTLEQSMKNGDVSTTTLVYKTHRYDNDSLSKIPSRIQYIIEGCIHLYQCRYHIDLELTCRNPLPSPAIIPLRYLLYPVPYTNTYDESQQSHFNKTLLPEHKLIDNIGFTGSKYLSIQFNDPTVLDGFIRICQAYTDAEIKPINKNKFLTMLFKRFNIPLEHISYVADTGGIYCHAVATYTSRGYTSTPAVKELAIVN